MTKVISIFNKKPIPPDPSVQPSQQARPEIRFAPGEVTRADLIASMRHDFRDNWRQATLFHEELGLSLEELQKHHVTLSDVGKAIVIAYVVKGDDKAVQYFLNLSSQMTADKQYYRELGTLSDEFKGYVWAMNFQLIINAAAFAEYQLGSIIGSPITRHIFY